MKELEKELRLHSDKKRAKDSQRYFKTGKGEYGEGDVFIGINNPSMRKIAKKFKDLNIHHIQVLLNSKIHEKRQIALFILTNRFKADKKERNKIFNFYLSNIAKNNINNWDLVDLSAPNIIGGYLLCKDRSILYDLARKDNLWSKRISVLATFAFIKNNDFSDSLKLAKNFLEKCEKHDLMQKAIGWMLREIGKKNFSVEENFLKKHYKKMPRTMLRYSIEKFPEDLRKKYLAGEI